MKTKPQQKRLVVLIAAAWALTYLGTAAAGDPPAAPEQQAASTDEQSATAAPADSKESHGLQVVTVNAERARGFRANVVQVGAFRDTPLLDVPLTISIIPPALLEEQNAQNLFDALKNSAGVTRSQTSGSVADNLAIRGIDINNRTSYRLNGSLPINNLIDLPLENKERVEALKGSAALYYGFTSPAGVVNLVTKRAKEAPISTVSLSGNEYGQWLTAVDIGRKFGANKQFGLRVNAVYGELRTPVKDTHGDRNLFSVAADWHVTDDLLLKLDVEKFRKNAVEQAAIGVPTAVKGVLTLPRVPDPTKLLSGPWARWEARAQNTLLRADYRINDDWALTAEAGRAETDRDARSSTTLRNYDVVTGAGTLQSQLVRGQVYLNKNYRAELAGRVEAWLDHELTLGVMQNKRYQNAPSQQTFSNPQNLYNPVVIPAPVYTLTPVYSPTDVTDNGLYFLDRIRLNQQWQVLAGVRKTHYTNDSIINKVPVESRVSNSTPSLGLIYKVRKDTSIYATYIEGLEEGATAPLTTKNASQILPPGVSKQKELGIRSDAISGMTATVAGFSIERATTYTNADNYFVLDGRTEYRGVEYSINGDLAPEWSVYVSGLFLDAKQKNAANATLIGKTPENTPKQSHSVFAEYHPRAFQGLHLSAGAYYIAKRPVNPADEAYISGVTLYTLGARYETRIAGHGATFQVNVENAGDKRYFNAVGFGFMGVGLPRTIKYNVKIDL